MSGPAISVLLPVRNGAPFIREAMASIFAQTWTDFELLVVDDGSTDATADIAGAHAADDVRVRVLRRPARGIVAALNEGLEAARAPLVARMDADDIAAPARLELQARAFAARPTLVALGGACRTVGAGLTRLRRPPTDPALVHAALDRGNPMIHPSVMFRRDVVRAAGGYRALFPHCEDYDLWLRLSEQGEVANLPDVLLSYRLHAGQSTQEAPERRILAEIAALQAARRRRAGLPEALPHAGADPDRETLRRMGMTDAEVAQAIIPRALGTAIEAGRAGDRAGKRAACALLLRQPGLAWRTRAHAYLLGYGFV